jgi:hypothetical protein
MKVETTCNGYVTVVTAKTPTSSAKASKIWKELDCLLKHYKSNGQKHHVTKCKSINNKSAQFVTTVKTDNREAKAAISSFVEEYCE